MSRRDDLLAKMQEDMKELEYWEKEAEKYRAPPHERRFGQSSGGLDFVSPSGTSSKSQTVENFLDAVAISDKRRETVEGLKQRLQRSLASGHPPVPYKSSEKYVNRLLKDNFPGEFDWL